MQYDPRASVFVVFWLHLIIALMVFSRRGSSLGAAPIGIAMAIYFSQVDVPWPGWTLVAPGLGLVASAAMVNLWAGWSIRGRIFSYLGNRDTPQFVHQQGIYRYIRHPFYTSYLLSGVAAALLYPSWLSLFASLGLIAFLTWATRFEEGKFLRSEVAAQYEAYKKTTGRFFPKL